MESATSTIPRAKIHARFGSQWRSPQDRAVSCQRRQQQHDDLHLEDFRIEEVQCGPQEHVCIIIVGRKHDFRGSRQYQNDVRPIIARTKVALRKPRGASVATMANSNTKAPSCVNASRSYAENTRIAPARCASHNGRAPTRARISRGPATSRSESRRSAGRAGLSNSRHRRR